jgi:hypothetical protein
MWLLTKADRTGVAFGGGVHEVVTVNGGGVGARCRQPRTPLTLLALLTVGPMVAYLDHIAGLHHGEGASDECFL